MKIRILILVMLASLFTSCRKYLDRYPLDAPSSANFPASKEELDVALTGVYNSLYRRLGGMIQDELFWDNVTDIGFVRGSYESSEPIMLGTASSRSFESHWSARYKGIQRANFIIEKMPEARKKLSAEICDRAEAEARFIRAYHYIFLTEKYGDVPLVTASLGLGENTLPRSPKSEVVDFILADLGFAADKLEAVYPEAEAGHVTKGAALALKSRVALYNGRYDIAASAAAAVMDMRIYSLNPSYGDLFQVKGNDSKEIIFELLYNPNVYKNTDQIFFAMNGWGGYSITVPTQWLVDAYLCTDGLPIDQSPLYDPNEPFKNRDPRLEQSLVVPGSWFAGVKYETHPDSIMTSRAIDTDTTRISNPTVLNTYASFTGYQWRKNSDETQFWQLTAGQGTMPLRMIRYGEVLLNYVEARIESGQIDQTVHDAFNLIRRRAGMPDIPDNISQSDFRKALRLEREIELAGEGFRMSDIRRWKIAEYVIPGDLPGRKNKSYWFNTGVPTINEYGHPVYQNLNQVFKIIQARKFNKDRDYLWAIPQTDLDLNKSLIQNPGY